MHFVNEFLHFTKKMRLKKIMDYTGDKEEKQNDI